MDMVTRTKKAIERGFSPKEVKFRNIYLGDFN
jgi:hypothetical protein